QPDRKTMLGRQGLSVDRVNQQHVILHRIWQREASLVKLIDPALHAAVQPREDNFGAALLQARLLEDRREGRSGPLGGAHRFSEPRLAQRAWGEPRAAIAGAFERDRQRGGGP